MPRGEGNGQGNFTHKGRRTGPLRKAIEKQMAENERRKKFLLQQREEAKRDILKVSSLTFRVRKGLSTQS
jgi:hypothetical protein